MDVRESINKLVLDLELVKMSEDEVNELLKIIDELSPECGEPRVAAKLYGNRSVLLLTYRKCADEVRKRIDDVNLSDRVEVEGR